MSPAIGWTLPLVGSLDNGVCTLDMKANTILPSREAHPIGREEHACFPNILAHNGYHRSKKKTKYVIPIVKINRNKIDKCTISM